MEGVGVGSIIDKDYLGELSVQDSQVFDIDAIWSDIAVFSIESMMDELIVRVEIVKDHIRVA